MTRNENIRRIAVYSVYILVLSSLQVTFSDVFAFAGQTADFMLVFVVVVGYLFGTKDAAVVGLLTGLARDYYSGPSLGGGDDFSSATLGIGMLTFMYIGIASSILFQKTFHRRLVFGFVQVIMFTIIYKTMGHLLTFIFQIFAGKGFEYIPISSIIVGSVAPQIAVNFFIAGPIILLLRYLSPYKKGINRMLIDELDRSEKSWQIV